MSDKAYQVILFIGAIILLLWGFSSLTEATLGVGLIALAGVLAVFMRIAQAAHHQKDNEEWLEKIFSQLTMMERGKRE